MFYGLSDWIQYKDYYIYLVKISWPALIGLFVIYLFIGLRFIHHIRNYRADNSARKKHWLLGIRLIVSLMVLAIYQDMLVKNYPDWLEQPNITNGVVYSLDVIHHPWGYDYIIGVKDGVNSQSFSVNKVIYDRLELDDYIKIEYLPVKKDVFRCTILT